MAFVFFYYIDKKWTISLCGKRGKIFKKKNDDSFPINAIKDVLKQFRIKIKDIDFCYNFQNMSPCIRTY